MRPLFVPQNLKMRKFGKDASKIARILNYIYRYKMYRNQYDCPVPKNLNFSSPIPINMEKLKKVLGENPRRLMEMICRLDKSSKEPVQEVILQVRRPYPYENIAGQYVFVEKYHVKPVHFHVPRLETAKFRKREHTTMQKMIDSFPKNYQIVCEHIKRLSLEITDKDRDELIQKICEKAIRIKKNECMEYEYKGLKKIFPNDSQEDLYNKAEQIWDHYASEMINEVEVEEENYDKILHLKDKILEVQHEAHFPVYSKDKQGRLNYYLTNMTEELRPFIRMDGKKLVSYDLGTSQCVFVWATLRDYIQNEGFTTQDILHQIDSILTTIQECDKAEPPEYIVQGLSVLKNDLNAQTLDREMNGFRKLLETDFYADIMTTINWKKLENGEYDRKAFKGNVLFPFLYGKNLSWKRNHMMQYFITKFPSVYCVLWKMRRLSEVCRTFYQLKSENGGQFHQSFIDKVSEQYDMPEFPKEMQRREADMFFNVIAPQIKQPFVTLHDSIIVQNGIRNNVKQIIEQAFRDKYQINVHVKREPWC